MPPDPRMSCFSKKRYADLKFAQKVQRMVEEERGTTLRVYACSECGGYHLTKLTG